MNLYTIGQRVRILGTFEDASGAPLDPSSVTLKLRRPNGAESTHVYGTDPDVVRDGAGAYHYGVDATLPDTWHYRWVGAGSAPCADESWFEVRQSNFAAP